ncbi:hypothetical protein [Novosphingobium resinovorum]|uniref:hypothetical protein n=1 Tax=Novosphingobium resinovorum TaxID=158500 RepID=UPI002ED5EA60|nr:hypothetical protein [Novosphingobium resinovorum]
MTFDWLSASPDARIELYRSCKRVVDGHFLGSWDRFYKLALGDNASFGVGYEDNFRKGRIARSKAAMLARWLSIHHTREAEQLAFRLRSLTNAPRS